MTLTITIELDSAAFWNDDKREPEPEVKYILEKMVERLNIGTQYFDGFPLLDSNGNTVGMVELA